MTKIQQVLLEALQIEDLSFLSDLEELSGYPYFYRIKFGVWYKK